MFGEKLAEGYRLVDPTCFDEACLSMVDYINQQAKTHHDVTVLCVNPGGRDMFPLLQAKYLLRYKAPVNFRALEEENIEAQLNSLGIDSKSLVILVDTAINTGESMQKVIDQLKQYCKTDQMQFAVIYNGKGVRKQEIDPHFWCIGSYDNHTGLEGCLVDGSKIVLVNKPN